MGRFAQAISEGDGISVVPILEGDVERLAGLAEQAGAEAVAVWSAPDVARARSRTTLPILVREPRVAYDPDRGVLGLPDADACVIVYERTGDDPDVEHVLTSLVENGVDCAVDVRDEEELERALERLDPDVILISERALDDDEEELERTLDLLPDVPAGKLVISEARVAAREQALALQRAGVDAILVRPGEAEFETVIAELAGRVTQ